MLEKEKPPVFGMMQRGGLRSDKMSVYCMIAALLLLVLATPANSNELSLSMVASADRQQVRLAYKRYMKSSNATERENIKAALQRSLDKDPKQLLNINGLNVANVCDGADIDLDSGLDQHLMVRRADRRIKRIQHSSVKPAVKQECIEFIKKFRACVASKQVTGQFQDCGI